MIDDTYKRLGIEAKEAKAGRASLIVFETAQDAAITAGWLGIGESIYQATDGFLLKFHGYFLTTDWLQFQEATRRIEINYKLV